MSEIIHDKWISIDETAAYLGVKPVTIRDWIKKVQEYLPIKLGSSGSSRYRNWILGLKVGKVPWIKISWKLLLKITKS